MIQPTIRGKWAKPYQQTRGKKIMEQNMATERSSQKRRMNKQYGNKVANTRRGHSGEHTPR